MRIFNLFRRQSATYANQKNIEIREAKYEIKKLKKELKDLQQDLIDRSIHLSGNYFGPTIFSQQTNFEIERVKQRNNLRAQIEIKKQGLNKLLGASAS